MPPGSSPWPQKLPSLRQPRSPMPLFQRRVIVNTGKGGVGKSTLTAAMALLAAAEGRRILVVELSGQCTMAPLLGGEVAGYEVVQRRPNLFSLSVTPDQSMEEYLIRELHSRRLYQLLFRNQVIGPFLEAVPGLEDLISIGKVMDLERELTPEGRPRWDLILVDAPSTGQGLNLLRVPRAMMEMTRVGPFYNNTRLIHDLLIDPRRTVVNLVTLPEEMPVNETLELYHKIHHELAIPMGYLVVNNLRRQALSEQEASYLPAIQTRLMASGQPDAALLSAVIRTAGELHRRASLERTHISRLLGGVGLPCLELPALPTRHLGMAELEALAARLQQGFSSLPLEEVPL